MVACISSHIINYSSSSQSHVQISLCSNEYSLQLLKQYVSQDLVLFTSLMGITSYFGYVAVCKRPAEPRKLLLYKILQISCIILWFLWSILRAGSFDGWSRIYNLLKSLPKGAAGFAMFLCFVENIGYYGAVAVGIFCMVRLEEVI